MDQFVDAMNRIAQEMQRRTETIPPPPPTPSEARILESVLAEAAVAKLTGPGYGSVIIDAAAFARLPWERLRTGDDAVIMSAIMAIERAIFPVPATGAEIHAELLRLDTQEKLRLMEKWAHGG